MILNPNSYPWAVRWFASFVIRSHNSIAVAAADRNIVRLFANIRAAMSSAVVDWICFFFIILFKPIETMKINNSVFETYHILFVLLLVQDILRSVIWQSKLSAAFQVQHLHYSYWSIRSTRSILARHISKSALGWRARWPQRTLTSVWNLDILR